MSKTKPIDKPEDLAIGDRVEFHDPFSNHRVVGKIEDIEIPRDPGCSEIWSDIHLRISDDTGEWSTFHTQLLSSAASYWIGGDSESEATPQEKGCYSLQRA